MSAFSADARHKNIEQMSGGHVYDLLVIGGGITGAGVARDAASRGMSVALIDARDFAEGTSSRSSKLIHGGIRYLENFEFGLVFEALSERARLFEIAPFLVHPLRFLLPVYRGSRVGMFKLGLGMWAYDALSMFDSPQMHERLSTSECLRKAPFLDQGQLMGGYAYSDAYMDDDRLVIETLRSAHRMGAACANYVKATGAVITDGIVREIRVQDQISKRDFLIHANHVVSTVGPWTDELGHALLGEWKKRLRPSKGIHITLDRSRLPLNEAVVMISDDEKRIVFAIPRHEMIIIGTTDTDYKGAIEDVHSTAEDVRYLLQITNSYFPNANIQVTDILASYAGVRPLIDDGSQSESKTSREHLIFTDPRGVTFVAGGKYTTYRRMAEQTVEHALRVYSREDQMRFAHGNTLEPLNPLASRDSQLVSELSLYDWAREYDEKVDVVARLAERHGEETRHILKAYRRLQMPTERLWAYEAFHAIEHTMCLSLKDFYLRRVPLFLARRDHGFPLLEDLAEIFARHFGWDSNRKKHEIERVREHVNFEMAWQNQLNI